MISSNAGLYIVRIKNRYLPVGTHLELTEDGYEEVVMELEDGEFVIHGHKGLIYPPSEISEYLIKIQESGVDDYALVPGFKRPRSYS